MLRSVARHARVYAKLILLQQRSHLEYEADFWVGVLGATLTQVAGFVFVWVLFSQVPAVAGWTAWEVAFLYGLAVIPNGLREVLCDGTWRLRLLINRGEFDRLLVRPLSPALQVITQLSSVFGCGTAALGAYVVLRARAELGLAWGPGEWAFLLLTLVSGLVLLAAVDFATNCVGFWDPSANSSFPFLVHNLVELAKFPLTVYGRLVQFALTWVLPFAFMSYYPGTVLLGRPEASPLLGYASPVAAAVMVCVAALVWHRGLRRYQGAGH
jgi:ABC-2 type transport system permease protein